MLYFYNKNNIQNNKLVKAVNWFLYSDWYLALIPILMVLANVFAQEMIVFFVFAAIVVFSLLFSPDSYPLMPLVCCGYMLFSLKNNPAKLGSGSFFHVPALKAIFIAICVIIGASVLARLVFDVIVVKRRKTVPKLTLGFIALGVAYLLGGAFSPYYVFKSSVFGLVQIGAICGFYYFFYYTIDWSKRTKADAAKIFTAVGVGLVVEIVNMYLTPNAYYKILVGTFTRGDLLTGWGINNNVGGTMAICLPAPMYLASKRKYGWPLSLLGFVFLAATFATQSRSSILFGSIIFGASCVFVLVYATKKCKLLNLAVFATAVILGATFSIIFKDTLTPIFQSLLDKGLDDSGRFEIYLTGMQQYFENPLLGQGFYQCGAWRFGNLPEDSFLPSRYHNTIVQLGASCGTVGIVAYVTHCLQIFIECIKKPASHKTFIGLGAAALAATSLLDCHFFNFGPGLLYGVLLVCMEMVPYTPKQKTAKQSEQLLEAVVA